MERVDAAARAGADDAGDERHRRSATLALAQPIVADRYADNPATGSFILIDEANNATVAAGMIR